MAVRTDRDRFRDPSYVGPLLRCFFGLEAGPLTPEQRAILNEEMRQFNEYWKGALDILMNLTLLGISTRTVCQYFELVRMTGGSPGGVRDVLKYTLQFCNEGKNGAAFIKHIVQHSGRISQAMMDMGKNSGKLLAFLVVFQVAIHASRGDYAKCMAEIVKVAVSGVVPVMAFLDLVDAIIGLIVPEQYLKHPLMRVIRGMNPAQCTGYITENLCWLVYCLGVAKQQGWVAFDRATAAWCAQMEKSPLAIYTCLSRDFSVFLDEYILPDSISRFSIAGVSLRNLADYARANPTAY